MPSVLDLMHSGNQKCSSHRFCELWTIVRVAVVKYINSTWSVLLYDIQYVKGSSKKFHPIITLTLFTWQWTEGTAGIPITFAYFWLTWFPQFVCRSSAWADLIWKAMLLAIFSCLYLGRYLYYSDDAHTRRILTSNKNLSNDVYVLT